jgi:hypothetical protein
VQYHANVDVSAPPFNRHLGETPAMTAQDEAAIIEFLKTMNDGCEPAKLVLPNNLHLLQALCHPRQSIFFI